LPTLRDRILTRLDESFAPSALEVIDESEHHRGHAGWRDGGESHFRVRMRAPSMASMGRLERHRAVHQALGPEIMGALHALALEIEVTPA
jgi:BolA protein